VCETLRRGYQGAVAAYAAQEGRKKNFRQIKDSNLHKWFYEVPGLKSELELLAWTHSSTLTSQSDFDGSRKQVRMMPRSFWDEDPRFLDTFAVAFREGLQRKFGELAFYPEKRYVCKFTIDPLPYMKFGYSRASATDLVRTRVCPGTQFSQVNSQK
jgi:hypothetical protein